jgi:hypothetical protein
MNRNGGLGDSGIHWMMSINVVSAETFTGMTSQLLVSKSCWIFDSGSGSSLSLFRCRLFNSLTSNLPRTDPTDDFAASGFAPEPYSITWTGGVLRTWMPENWPQFYEALYNRPF